MYLSHFLLNKIKNKEKIFLSVYRIYWMLFFPITRLVSYYYKDNLIEENAGTLIAFFFATSAIAVFFMELLRVIFNQNKRLLKGHGGFIFLFLFALWGWFFVISFVVITSISAFNYLVGYSIDLTLIDIPIYILILMGEPLLRYSKKISMEYSH